MKSVLHEASSILKAIEKAWEASGKPSEFSVKVLEEGESKFFFFSSKPAIVSISFDQRHVARTSQSTNKNRPNDRDRSGSTQERLLNGGSPQLDNVRNTQSRPNSRGHDQNRPQQRAQRPQQDQQQRPQPLSPQQPAAPRTPSTPKPMGTPQPSQSNSALEQAAIWTPELAMFVGKELNEILHIMNITIPFQEKIDQKTLTLTFANPPMDNKEDARLFYISLSYLLIQAAKKQEKKKLRGFHLIVTANS